jgi:hypothetical protein
MIFRPPPFGLLTINELSCSKKPSRSRATIRGYPKDISNRVGCSHSRKIQPISGKSYVVLMACFYAIDKAFLGLHNINAKAT